MVTLYAQDNVPDLPAPNNNRTLTQSFTIRVNAVNDAPQFTLRDTLTPVNRAEDANNGAQQTIPGLAFGILPGPTSAIDEQPQNVTFDLSVATTGNLAFTVQPDIDEQTGDLTFAVAPHTNGIATVTVTLMDDGTSTPPNVNISPPQVFKIQIAAVNDEPVFTLNVAPVERLEDSGLQVVPNQAFDIAPGPVEATDETFQIVTFITRVVSPDGFSFFEILPTIDPNGTLSFKTNLDKHGTAQIGVRARDDGDPNDNLSDEQFFNIVIAPVNDAPDFTLKLPLPAVNEDADAQRIFDFLTNVRPGGTDPDEADQTVTFTGTKERKTGV